MEQLKIGESVYALAETLKKKDALGRLCKSTTKGTPFFNKDQLFVLIKEWKLGKVNIITHLTLDLFTSYMPKNFSIKKKNAFRSKNIFR